MSNPSAANWSGNEDKANLAIAEGMEERIVGCSQPPLKPIGDLVMNSFVVRVVHSWVFDEET